jgi:hypothetical protein
VVSLLYVVSEFRRSATLTSQEVNVVLYERTRAFEEMLVEAPALADIVIVATGGSDALSEADRLRYLAYQHVFFDTWEIAWDYHDDGILDDPMWDSWNAWFVSEARRRPDFGWTQNRHNYTGPGFIRHVDESVLSD